MQSAQQAGSLIANGAAAWKFVLQVLEHKWEDAMKALFWQSVFFLLEIGLIDAIASSEGVFRLIVTVTGKMSRQLDLTCPLVELRAHLQQRGCMFAPVVQS